LIVDNLWHLLYQVNCKQMLCNCVFGKPLNSHLCFIKLSAQLK